MTVKSAASHHTYSLHLQRILDATHHNPFEFLGTHQDEVDGPWFVRVFQPDADKIWVKINKTWQPLALVDRQGLFEYASPVALTVPAQLRIQPHGKETYYETTDTYSFKSTIPQEDIYLFGEGRLLEAYNTLGAIPMTVDGVEGVRFAVWAPSAARVSVVGSFNQWDGRVHAMRVLGGSGV
ncbi:MAG: 1,4-alpha-glucan branching enzyme, partial [Methylophilus sp.]